MKTIATLLSNRLLRPGLFIFLACFFAAPAARAGLTVNLLMYHTAPGLSAFVNPYAIVASLSTNTTAPAAPLGHYILSSPGTASHSQYDLTSSNFASFGSSANSYTDFNSFIQQVTNGNWTITVTSNASTNVYAFAVNASSFTSNGFSAPVVVTFPTNNAVNVTNQPTFTWHGPSPWAGSLTVEDYNSDFSFFQSADLPTTQTSWTVPVTLPDSNHTFGVFYISNASPVIVASTPTNINGGTPISGWVSTATMETYQFIPFSVSKPSGGSPGSGGGSTGHTNVAHYTFEDHNLFAHDYSGQNNNVISYGYSGGATNVPYLTNDAVAGSFAMGYTGSGWQSPATNLVATLARSFSVSLWVRTSQSHGNNSDAASSGAGLLAANYDQVIPMALTGSKLAFLTGGGSADTLHSATSINTGNYVHLVVTRNQATGRKNIYVNGVLDASDSGATGFLTTASDPNLYLGMNSTFVAGLLGDLDEVQIYSGVLSSNEVLQLHNNPATTIPNRTDLEAALDTTGLTWTTDGDTSWFLESTNSHDGVSAAQSGGVTNGQVSVLQTTVTGPGTLAFWWSTQTPVDETFFDLEFDIDGSYHDNIYNNQPWVQESTINIPAGSHTLTWIAFGGDHASDAGFVDQVSYTPTNFTTVLQSAEFHFVLVNDQSVITPGGGYWVEPYLFDVQPEPVTVDEIVSPNGKFTYTYTNSITPGALHHDPVNSWAELADECTNGLWTLYVNKGDPSEKQFTFSVTLNGLDTTLLSPVTILTPADGSVNVATNSPVEWSLPNSTSAYIFVAIGNVSNNLFYTYMGNNLGLLGGTTNWLPSDPMNYGPGGFNYGTNDALLQIYYYSLPAIASTTPTNAAFDVISNWTTTGEIETRSSDSFVVGAPAPLPVQLISSLPQTNGGDFALSFQTLAGRPVTIQVSTNLGGAWMDFTNFIGDGSVQMFTFPTTNAPGEYFRVMMQ
jgi:hypothetical protein